MPTTATNVKALYGNYKVYQVFDYFAIYYASFINLFLAYDLVAVIKYPFTSKVSNMRFYRAFSIVMSTLMALGLWVFSHFLSGRRLCYSALYSIMLVMGIGSTIYAFRTLNK